MREKKELAELLYVVSVLIGECMEELQLNPETRPSNDTLQMMGEVRALMKVYSMSISGQHALFGDDEVFEDKYPF